MFDVQIFKQHGCCGTNRDVGDETEPSHEFESASLLTSELLRPRSVVFLHLLLNLLKFVLEALCDEKSAAEVESAHASQNRNLLDVHF